MNAARIYQSISLSINQRLSLSDQASHHLARVLRAKVGDEVILFNGQGGEYNAVITHISKKNVEVDVLKFIDKERESPIQLCLAQGIARGEKMDFIIQKSIELGVNTIAPLLTERCNVRLDAEREAKRLKHWQSIAISACEQSGRNRIPEILAPQSLANWLSTVKADIRFVLSPHVHEKLNVDKSSRSIALLIGSEGGLSDNEVALAHQFQFQNLQLGPRVLRTETATIAALTVLQDRLGDLC